MSDDFTGPVPEWAADRIHINVNSVKFGLTDRIRILIHGRVFFDCRINLQHKVGKYVPRTGIIVPRMHWPGWLPRRRPKHLPFHSWMKMLDIEGEPFGMVGEDAPSLLGEEVWMGYWQDGLTPMQALQEDVIKVSAEEEEKDKAEEVEQPEPDTTG